MYEKRIMEVFGEYYSHLGKSQSKFIRIDEEVQKQGRHIRIILDLPAKTAFIKHLDYLFGVNGVLIGEGTKIIIIYLLK